MSHIHIPGHFTGQRQIETFTSNPAAELTEMSIRLPRLIELRIPMNGAEVFDDVADDLAERTGFLYSMVNIFAEEQTFIGLHNPSGPGHQVVGRTMSRRDGWCPKVVERKLALGLPDVHASPRFTLNRVVVAMRIRSYFGAPLIDEQTGIALGTVCVIDTERRSLRDARRLLAIVKATAGDAHDLIKALPAAP